MAVLKKLFNGKEVHPVVLDVALFQTFGPEWASWDADSTFIAIERQVDTVPSKAVQSKIHGLTVLHNNHAYWEDWRAFEAVSWALSGKQIDLVQLNPLRPIPLVYGVRTSHWIDSKPKFSEDVTAYIISVFLNEQFSLLPKDLAGLQKRYLEKSPNLKERSDQVKSALLSNKSGSSFEEAEEDPVIVEITKHHILESMMNLICSPDFILAQARKYGLQHLVEPILRDSN